MVNIDDLKETFTNIVHSTVCLNNSLKLIYEQILNNLKSFNDGRILNVSDLIDNSTDLIQSTIIISITDSLELPNHTVSEYSLVSPC